MILGKVTLRKEGIHYYKDAWGQEEFLKHSHRHEFHITVWFEQFHDDRDIEYIQCKRFLEKVIDLSTMEGKSCEMLAGIIIGLMQGKYGLGRKYRVEVLEDGENGAVVDWV